MLLKPLCRKICKAYHIYPTLHKGDWEPLKYAYQKLVAINFVSNSTVQRSKWECAFATVILSQLVTILEKLHFARIRPSAPSHSDPSLYIGCFHGCRCGGSRLQPRSRPRGGCIGSAGCSAATARRRLPPSSSRTRAWCSSAPASGQAWHHTPQSSRQYPQEHSDHGVQHSPSAVPAVSRHPHLLHFQAADGARQTPGCKGSSRAATGHRCNHHPEACAGKSGDKEGEI